MPPLLLLFFVLFLFATQPSRRRPLSRPIGVSSASIRSRSWLPRNLSRAFPDSQASLGPGAEDSGTGLPARSAKAARMLAPSAGRMAGAEISTRERPGRAALLAKPSLRRSCCENAAPGGAGLRLQPPTANRQPPTANRQPPTANRQPPTANRQPPTANRQPPTANRQPPTANRQPPTANRQPPTANRQPPTANRQPLHPTPTVPSSSLLRLRAPMVASASASASTLQVAGSGTAIRVK